MKNIAIITTNKTEIMEISKIKTKYRQKALESFRTRLNLLLFERVIQKNTMDSISEMDLKTFKATNELINIFTTQYYQLDYDKCVESITVGEIWKILSLWDKTNNELLENLQHYYVDTVFQDVFPFEDFETLFDENPNRKCHYCGITEEMIRKLIQKQKLYKKRERGFILELDRKKPNEEYTMNNSVLCCYWCNNAKTDEFCANEFKKIGEEIGKIWEKRLSK